MTFRTRAIINVQNKMMVEIIVFLLSMAGRYWASSARAVYMGKLVGAGNPEIPFCTISYTIEHICSAAAAGSWHYLLLDPLNAPAHSVPLA